MRIPASLSDVQSTFAVTARVMSYILPINDSRDNLGYAFKVVAVAVPLLSYLRRTVDVSSDKILVLVGYVIITFLILVLLDKLFGAFQTICVRLVKSNCFV